MCNFGPYLLIIFGLRHETAFAVEVSMLVVWYQNV